MPARSLSKPKLCVRAFLTTQGSFQRRPSRLARLISNRKWKRTSEYLCTEDGLADALDIENSQNSDNILHLACREGAPVEIMHELVKASPRASKQPNCSSQYPLHIASMCGASPQVVHLLLREYAEAASFQDRNGKTPLHLYFECFRLEEMRKVGTIDGVEHGRGGLMEALILILEAAPQSVNVEDHKDMTPIEHAIQNGAPLNVVTVLQKTSEFAWKSRGAEGSSTSLLPLLQPYLCYGTSSSYESKTNSVRYSNIERTMVFPEEKNCEKRDLSSILPRAFAYKRSINSAAA